VPSAGVSEALLAPSVVLLVAVALSPLEQPVESPKRATQYKVAPIMRVEPPDPELHEVVILHETPKPLRRPLRAVPGLRLPYKGGEQLDSLRRRGPDWRQR
jgi:hypothetical protein